MQVFTTRKLDPLGRLVLPRELLDKLGLQQDSALNVCLDGQGHIVLAKPQEHCVLCGELQGLTHHNGRAICAGCIQRIKAL